MNPVRTVALGAHCDDLAFSLGGALRDGRFGDLLPLTIFTVSGYTAAGCADPSEVTSRRKEEDRSFFSDLPGERAPLWLNRLDAPLRLGIGVDEVQAVSFEAREEAEAESLCREVRPLLLLESPLLAPLALGNHVDHRIVRQVAVKLAPGRTVLFYEDLPYAGEMTLGEIDKAVTELADLLGAKLHPLLLPSAGVATARERAVASYRSQTDERSFETLMRHPRRLAVNGVPAERAWRWEQEPLR